MLLTDRLHIYLAFLLKSNGPIVLALFYFYVRTVILYWTRIHGIATLPNIYFTAFSILIIFYWITVTLCIREKNVFTWDLWRFLLWCYNITLHSSACIAIHEIVEPYLVTVILFLCWLWTQHLLLTSYWGWHYIVTYSTSDSLFRCYYSVLLTICWICVRYWHGLSQVWKQLFILSLCFHEFALCSKYAPIRLLVVLT